MPVVPGLWVPPTTYRLDHRPWGQKTPIFEEAFIIEGFLTLQECEDLIQLMPDRTQPVSVSGHPLTDSQAVGSHRATAFSREMGGELWGRLQHHVPRLWDMMETTPTDWYSDGVRKEYRRWAPVGVSPVLRFMRYRNGGEHNTHYDAGYQYPADPRRTLMSFVLYLQSDLQSGGETRFIEDGQGKIPTPQRNFEDWVRRAKDSEVVFASPPVQGNLLVFGHRRAHDVSPYLGATQDRIIIRGDVEFIPLS